MQLTVYVRRQEPSLWSILKRKHRRVIFDETFDPLTLLGYEGGLVGKRRMELGISVRLWPTPDCETFYQELLSQRFAQRTDPHNQR